MSEDKPADVISLAGKIRQEPKKLNLLPEQYPLIQGRVIAVNEQAADLEGKIVSTTISYQPFNVEQPRKPSIFLHLLGRQIYDKELEKFLKARAALQQKAVIPLALHPGVVTGNYVRSYKTRQHYVLDVVTGKFSGFKYTRIIK